MNFEKQVEEMRKKGYNDINAKDAIESTNICIKELRKCSPTIRQVLPDTFSILLSFDCSNVLKQ
jgi:hypothetical protein